MGALVRLDVEGDRLDLGLLALDEHEHGHIDRDQGDGDHCGALRRVRVPQRQHPSEARAIPFSPVAAIDVVRKYLDAGLEQGQVTREKAEELVNDLVKAGEVRAEDVRSAVKDLIDRSRKQSEALSERVRSEVKDQLAKVQPVTQADLAALNKRIAAVERKTAAAKKPAARKPAAKKPAAKKPAARKSSAK